MLFSEHAGIFRNAIILNGSKAIRFLGQVFTKICIIAYISLHFVECATQKQTTNGLF